MATNPIHKSFEHVGEAWYSKRDPNWMKRMQGLRDLIVITVEDDNTELICTFSLEWRKVMSRDRTVEMRLVINQDNALLSDIVLGSLTQMDGYPNLSPLSTAGMLTQLGYENKTRYTPPDDVAPFAMELEEALSAVRDSSSQHKKEVKPWDEDSETVRAYLDRIWVYANHLDLEVKELRSQRDTAYQAISRAVTILETVQRTYNDTEITEEHRHGMMTLTAILLRSFPMPLVVATNDDPNDIPF